MLSFHLIWPSCPFESCSPSCSTGPSSGPEPSCLQVSSREQPSSSGHWTSWPASCFRLAARHGHRGWCDLPGPNLGSRHTGGPKLASKPLGTAEEMIRNAALTFEPYACILKVCKQNEASVCFCVRFENCKTSQRNKRVIQGLHSHAVPPS